MKSIVLLSGPPGAGKTTVAKALVDLSPSPVACIEGDDFWKFFAKQGPEQSMKQNFRLMMSSMIAAALPFARADHEVIIDFSIPPWFLDTALHITSRRDVPLNYVVVMPSEEVCAARAGSRGEGKIDDYAAYKEFYSSFKDQDRYAIRDDTGSAESVAAQIRKGLDDARFLVK